MSIIHELLRVDDEDKRRARKMFNKTEEDIQRNLDILLQWLEKQPHLPCPHDKTRLETFLLRNKFRVERTKSKIDNYYTYRGLYSDFFLNLDPTSRAIENLRNYIMWVPMPKLSPTAERITVCKILEDPSDICNWRDMFTYMLIVLDLQLSHDYAVGERYVVDVKNVSMNFILKVDPTITHKGFFLSEKAFSGRIVSIEYINLPPKFNYILNIIKRVLKASVFDKITTHNSVESLYKVIPKECLPQDYGGYEESMAVLHEKWGKELIHQRNFLIENGKRISNEKLRIGEPIKNELFGLDGTFKKINLD